MRNKKLTLIELIITVLVLGLLVGLAIPQFTGVKANADVASFKNDIDVLSKAIDESYVKEDSLPLGEKVAITDPVLLDVIYASGDSALNLYKVDLSKTGKYHSKLKSVVNADNYFIYSTETGKVFYTKGLVDGDDKTLYTLEYVGLAGVKLGGSPLINGMSVPVDEPAQTITGNVPATSVVEVKVNGTDLPMTVEDVVFEEYMDLVAGIKTKGFTSEAVLSAGVNVITIKVNSQVTNFKINLGENGAPVVPDVPVIKPVAVISMTPEQGLTTATNITWGYENSTAAEGRTIKASEWEGKQNIYTAEGNYTARLRVQDSTNVWSDWVEKSFAVISADGIKKITAGNSHTIVLKNDGTVWAVGYNSGGALGTGDNLKRSTFTQVQSGVKDIEAGEFQTFIIKEDNSLWATGTGNNGELGTGGASKNNFVKVQSDVKMVSSGAQHTVILKMDGTLWATGSNSEGQLGTGNTTGRTSFVQVQSDVKSVAAGGVHTLIIKEDSSLWATGRNSEGQLGTGDTTKRTTFVQVQSGVKSVAAGNMHTLILKEDDTLWATGHNYYGQLGTGNTTQRTTFIQVQSGVKSVVAGGNYSLIIKEDSTLWATGYNEYGQLGDGTIIRKVLFTQVNTNVLNMAAGATHTIISKLDGSTWTTGSNVHSQLGRSGSTIAFGQVQY